MKLIKPHFEILEQEPGLDGIYKAIERAGRTCYKSEDKITEDSAKKFVDILINRGHTACLEQGTVYLHWDITKERYADGSFYATNPYSRVTSNGSKVYITTNYRVLLENNKLSDLKYLCEPTEHHAKRVTVRFICDRGVSHELVRHRVFSFAQESTRYCNYSKDKFGNELTFIIPSWLNVPEDRYSLGKLRSKDNPEETCMVEVSENNGAYNIESPIGKFLHVLDYSSDRYLELISEGYTPQQARQVLPNALKTEVVMTGFISDWNHFFNLRCALDAHPDMRALAQPLFEEFCHREYIHTEG